MQVLHQFDLIGIKVGQIVIAAAVLDDVIALYLLALAHGSLGGGLAPERIVGSVVLVLLVVTAIFWVCRALARSPGRALIRTGTGFALAAGALLIMASGWLTDRMGYSLAVGGFFAGLGIGEGLEEVDRQRLHNVLQRLVFVLVPFFFVLIGTRAQWNVLTEPGMPVLVVGLVIVALLGKTAGGALGAIGTRNWRTRLLIGVSMAPRGEIVLVIATLGFQQGHVSHHLMVALILVTVVAALSAPLLMMPLARREQRPDASA